ncbi:polysaccharide pyruvyl transferase family protein [uncultured Draconibacterium sp.]|uniref:polysaccharide pyruvyl transferase family protein n=1 Tax=uncultured Draconibacterium sp. TaxID=1573823 RepID=UPI0032611508
MISAIFFFLKNRNYKSTKKIFYCLIPPPELKNIGDHAQAVTIRIWLSKNFSDYKIIEIDKNNTRSKFFVWAIKKVLSSKDLFFVHSGGNLSDRAPWSENGRRMIVKSFKNNLVCVLPQTIHFSNTENGEIELERSKKIYNNHPKLIITGRDMQSTALAKKHFYSASIMSCPDFVLLYSNYLKNSTNIAPSKEVLFCFRNDSESAFTKKDRMKFTEMNAHLSHEVFDTTIEEYIFKKDEQKFLDDTINYFSSFKVIITDRYHGLIFCILAKRPCIVLHTVDHKLTAAYTSWFKNMQGIYLANDIPHAQELLPNVLANSSSPVSDIDWNDKYFKNYTTQIKSNDSIS